MTIYQTCLAIEKDLEFINTKMDALRTASPTKSVFKKISSLEKRMMKNLLKISKLEDKLDELC